MTSLKLAQLLRFLASYDKEEKPFFQAYYFKKACCHVFKSMLAKLMINDRVHGHFLLITGTHAHVH